ncbi:unnamed protein product [Somion occarium]|uniref:Uncharacterized protein n=1 Tax=Somion occarium TaxID=3059160 RepID=A0ABP1CIC8_9APHY
MFSPEWVGIGEGEYTLQGEAVVDMEHAFCHIRQISASTAVQQEVYIGSDLKTKAQEKRINQGIHHFDTSTDDVL